MWNSQAKWVWLLAVAMGAVVGCAEQTAKDAGEQAAESKTPASASQPSAQGDADPSTSAQTPSPSAPTFQEVKLTVATPEQLKEALNQQKGRVVLVDYWATWCIPCIENFHHAVEWQQEYGDEGLTVISVSMDEPDNQEAALDFLRGQQARFPNFLSKLGGGDEGMLAFGVEGGAVPQYKIYNRKGQLVKTFGVNTEPPFTTEDIEKTLKATLEEKPQ